MSKKKGKKKRFGGQDQKIPPVLKVYKKKINKIYQLEKEYWDEIQKRRSYLSETAPDINHNLEAFFPSNVSSRIYNCGDGVVLLRYAISNLPNKFDILYCDETLEHFLDHLPVPTLSGDINLSPFIRLGPGSDLKIINSTFNDVIIEWLWVNSFLYSDEEKLAQIEEALTDFKMYLIGLAIDPAIRPLESKNKDTENILGKLEDIVDHFGELLGNVTKEEEIQEFLKEYTILMQPYTEKIPKQKLGQDWVTDFVLVNMLDQGPKYTFVEIEKPSMGILTRGREFMAEFKHAEKQILDWDIWLQDNQDYIQRKLKGFESPTYLIIGGRSKDMGEEEKRYIRAWNRSQKNTRFLTYDDLLEGAKELLLTLRRDVGG